jgi:hypothetical protein
MEGSRAAHRHAHARVYVRARLRALVCAGEREAGHSAFGSVGDDLEDEGPVPARVGDLRRAPSGQRTDGIEGGEKNGCSDPQRAAQKLPARHALEGTIHIRRRARSDGPALPRVIARPRAAKDLSQETDRCGSLRALVTGRGLGQAAGFAVDESSQDLLSEPEKRGVGVDLGSLLDG